MKTLRVANGDIMPGPRGYQMVSRIDKIQQDLAAATLESLGTDRFHPGWGSTLKDFIGLPVTEHSDMLIEGEISRIIRNYVMGQSEISERDSIDDVRPRLSLEEAVSDIESITITQDFDRVIVRVVVQTIAGNRFPIEAEVAV